MSLAGPRPGLFNEDELTLERDIRYVFDVRPGVTGLSQISKVDMSTPKLLAETDAKIIQCLTIIKYFDYIIKTVLGKGYGDRVK